MKKLIKPKEKWREKAKSKINDTSENFYDLWQYMNY